MVRSLKYFLSLCLLFLCACAKENIDDLSPSERRTISMKIFKEGERLPQGSPVSMTRLEKAIQMDSTNSYALRELSVAYLKRGMMAEWKVRYDKAVEANPEVWIPIRGYLHLLFHRDYESAIEDFNTSDSLTPSFKDAPQGQSVDYWRGLAYLGKKDYENAISNLENHIALETSNSSEDWVEVTTFLYLGIAYYEQGDYSAALTNFDKMIYYNQNVTADGHYYKAKTLVALKQEADALILAQKALADFRSGSFHSHDYVEVIRQIYESDITELIRSLNKKPLENQ